MSVARRGARRLVRLGAVGAAFLVTGCAANAPMDFLEPSGSLARRVDSLWDIGYWLAVAVFVIVEGLLVFALFRFRARKSDTDPAQTHGNTKVEVAWTIAPAVLLAVLAIPTVTTIFALAEEPSDDALRVTVTGYRWWFGYEYEGEDVTTANILHIPTDRDVFLTLESADVIHSFWIPKLAGKQDVIPGRTNHLTVRAEEPGPYRGQCAEFCGLSHANMWVWVEAHEPEEFDRWLRNQKRPPVEPTDRLAARGKELFEGGACVGCHVLEGVSDIDNPIGPNLTHFASRRYFAGGIFERTDENLTEWIADAPDMKPGSLMPSGIADLGLSEEDVEALVAYLQSLE